MYVEYFCCALDLVLARFKRSVYLRQEMHLNPVDKCTNWMVMFYTILRHTLLSRYMNNVSAMPLMPSCMHENVHVWFTHQHPNTVLSRLPLAKFPHLLIPASKARQFDEIL